MKPKMRFCTTHLSYINHRMHTAGSLSLSCSMRRFLWNMSPGQSLVVAVFLAASCTLATGSSICLNDSAFPDSGEGEYAPVLLVGRYKMKVDSANEQVGASLQVSSPLSILRMYVRTYASTGVPYSGFISWVKFFANHWH